MNLRKDHYHTYTECGARCTTQSAVPGVRAGSHGGARVQHLHTPAIRLTLCAARAAHNPFSRFSRFATSFIHNYKWCVCAVARETCVLRMDSERETAYRSIYINTTTILPRKLSAVDVLALATMKNAAKCDT